MPTVASFKSAIIGGYGYGLLPEIDIDTELKNKTLINISKNKSFRVPLYLHHWEYQSDVNKLFIERVLRASKSLRISQ
jgi:LysR family transcriptional regulator (chromosome initiation inhibitor)